MRKTVGLIVPFRMFGSTRTGILIGTGSSKMTREVAQLGSTDALPGTLQSNVSRQELSGTTTSATERLLEKRARLGLHSPGPSQSSTNASSPSFDTQRTTNADTMQSLTTGVVAGSAPPAVREVVEEPRAPGRGTRWVNRDAKESPPAYEP